MRVAVIGGGITGLVVARDLDASGASVTLFEAGGRLGGKIETLRVRGVPVEAGPDWFLTRNPAAIDLATDLGLADELTPPSRGGASVLRSGSLVELPESQVRGVPLRPFEAARAGVITRTEALRALVDLVLPGRVTGPDVSVGELIRKRLGSGVLERMADPMLAASRAGRALDLSLEAAAPELDQIARRRSSLIRGLRAHKEQSRTADGPPFLGIGSGMESLVQRLHDSLGTVELRIGDEVKDLARHGDSYFLSGAREEEFDAVILAIPSHSAAAVLRQASPRTARLLSTIRYSSAVVAVLVYEEGSLTPPDRGSGFLVPTIEGRGVTAGAWYSLKWEQARPSDNSTVIRCFAGRARDDPVLNVDETGDDELRSRLVREVGEITKTRKRPAEIHLKRWPLALPQYEVGHNRRVADAEATLASDLPRVRIAGAGYRGSGLPDCISQAHAAARILMG